jgi:hypothetical protein
MRDGDPAVSSWTEIDIKGRLELVFAFQKTSVHLPTQRCTLHERLPFNRSGIPPAWP